MKMYVSHDDQGKIVAISLPNAEKGQDVGIVTESGRAVCEVDLAEDPANFSDSERATKRLMEIAERFRVDVPIRPGKLISVKDCSK